MASTFGRGRGRGGPGGARPPPPGGAHVSADQAWRQMRDPRTGKAVWFNQVTGARSAVPPPGHGPRGRGAGGPAGPAGAMSSADSGSASETDYGVTSGGEDSDARLASAKGVAAAASEAAAAAAAEAAAAQVLAEAGWGKRTDPKTGRPFYFHRATKRSGWRLPNDVQARVSAAEARARAQGGAGRSAAGSAAGSMTSGGRGDQGGDTSATEEDDDEEDDSTEVWEMRKDPISGRPYYVNPVTRERSWRRPGGHAEVWERRTDAKSGRTYFLNIDTKQSSWNLPIPLGADGQPRQPGAKGAPKEKPGKKSHGNKGSSSDGGGAGGRGWAKIASGVGGMLSALTHLGKSDASAASADETSSRGEPSSSSSEDDPNWKETVDKKTGRKYFYHKKSKKTAWTRPRRRKPGHKPKPAPPKGPSPEELAAAAAKAEEEKEKEDKKRKNKLSALVDHDHHHHRKKERRDRHKKKKKRKRDKEKKQAAGASKPLWKSVVDPKTNRTYYVNNRTKARQWEKPSPDELKVMIQVDGSAATAGDDGTSSSSSGSTGSSRSGSHRSSDHSKSKSRSRSGSLGRSRSRSRSQGSRSKSRSRSRSRDRGGRSTSRSRSRSPSPKTPAKKSGGLWSVLTGGRKTDDNGQHHRSRHHHHRHHHHRRRRTGDSGDSSGSERAKHKTRGPKGAQFPVAAPLLAALRKAKGSGSADEAGQWTRAKRPAMGLADSSRHVMLARRHSRRIARAATARRTGAVGSDGDIGKTAPGALHDSESSDEDSDAAAIAARDAAAAASVLDAFASPAVMKRRGFTKEMRGGDSDEESSAAARSQLRGYLSKKGRSGFGMWRKRWFVVRGPYLTYYDNAESTDMLAAIDMRFVKDLGRSSVDAREIVITGPEIGKYQLRAETAVDAALWFVGLLQALLKCGCLATGKPTPLGVRLAKLAELEKEDDQRRRGSVLSGSLHPGVADDIPEHLRAALSGGAGSAADGAASEAGGERTGHQGLSSDVPPTRAGHDANLAVARKLAMADELSTTGASALPPAERDDAAARFAAIESVTRTGVTLELQANAKRVTESRKLRDAEEAARQDAERERQQSEKAKERAQRELALQRDEIAAAKRELDEEKERLAAAVREREAATRALQEAERARVDAEQSRAEHEQQRRELLEAVAAAREAREQEEAAAEEARRVRDAEERRSKEAERIREEEAAAREAAEQERLAEEEATAKARERRVAEEKAVEEAERRRRAAEREMAELTARREEEEKARAEAEARRDEAMAEAEQAAKAARAAAQSAAAAVAAGGSTHLSESVLQLIADAVAERTGAAASLTKADTSKSKRLALTDVFRNRDRVTKSALQPAAAADAEDGAAAPHTSRQPSEDHGSVDGKDGAAGDDVSDLDSQEAEALLQLDPALLSKLRRLVGGGGETASVGRSVVASTATVDMPSRGRRKRKPIRWLKKRLGIIKGHSASHARPGNVDVPPLQPPEVSRPPLPMTVTTHERRTLGYPGGDYEWRGEEDNPSFGATDPAYREREVRMQRVAQMRAEGRAHAPNAAAPHPDDVSHRDGGLGGWRAPPQTTGMQVSQRGRRSGPGGAADVEFARSPRHRSPPQHQRPPPSRWASSPARTETPSRLEDRDEARRAQMLQEARRLAGLADGGDFGTAPAGFAAATATRGGGLEGRAPMSPEDRREREVLEAEAAADAAEKAAEGRRLAAERVLAAQRAEAELLRNRDAQERIRAARARTEAAEAFTPDPLVVRAGRDSTSPRHDRNAAHGGTSKRIVAGESPAQTYPSGDGAGALVSADEFGPNRHETQGLASHGATPTVEPSVDHVTDRRAEHSAPAVAGAVKFGEEMSVKKVSADPERDAVVESRAAAHHVASVSHTASPPTAVVAEDASGETQKDRTTPSSGSVADISGGQPGAATTLPRQNEAVQRIRRPAMEPRRSGTPLHVSVASPAGVSTRSESAVDTVTRSSPARGAESSHVDTGFSSSELLSFTRTVRAQLETRGVVSRRGQKASPIIGETEPSTQPSRADSRWPAEADQRAGAASARSPTPDAVAIGAALATALAGGSDDEAGNDRRSESDAAPRTARATPFRSPADSYAAGSGSGRPYRVVRTAHYGARTMTPPRATAHSAQRLAVGSGERGPGAEHERSPFHYTPHDEPQPVQHTQGDDWMKALSHAVARGMGGDDASPGTTQRALTRSDFDTVARATAALHRRGFLHSDHSNHHGRGRHYVGKAVAPSSQAMRQLREDTRQRNATVHRLMAALAGGAPLSDGSRQSDSDVVLRPRDGALGHLCGALQRSPGLCMLLALRLRPGDQATFGCFVVDRVLCELSTPARRVFDLIDALAAGEASWLRSGGGGGAKHGVEANDGADGTLALRQRAPLASFFDAVLARFAARRSSRRYIENAVMPHVATLRAELEGILSGGDDGVGDERQAAGDGDAMRHDSHKHGRVDTRLLTRVLPAAMRFVAHLLGDVAVAAVPHGLRQVCRTLHSALGQATARLFLVKYVWGTAVASFAGSSGANGLMPTVYLGVFPSMSTAGAGSSSELHNVLQCVLTVLQLIALPASTERLSLVVRSQLAGAQSQFDAFFAMLLLDDRDPPHGEAAAARLERVGGGDGEDDADDIPGDAESLSLPETTDRVVVTRHGLRLLECAMLRHLRGEHAEFLPADIAEAARILEATSGSRDVDDGEDSADERRAPRDGASSKLPCRILTLPQAEAVAEVGEDFDPSVSLSSAKVGTAAHVRAVDHVLDVVAQFRDAIAAFAPEDALGDVVDRSEAGDASDPRDVVELAQQVLELERHLDRAAHELAAQLAAQRRLDWHRKLLSRDHEYSVMVKAARTSRAPSKPRYADGGAGAASPPRQQREPAHKRERRASPRDAQSRGGDAARDEAPLLAERPRLPSAGWILRRQGEHGDPHLRQAGSRGAASGAGQGEHRVPASGAVRSGEGNPLALLMSTVFSPYQLS